MFCVATSDPRCFPPVTMYGTTDAHLVHMCWPLSWALYRSFGSSITFVLDETHWHRINAKVASHVFSLLASVEGTTVCLEIPLQSPRPRGDRHLATVSPPHPGDCRALTREFARGVQGTSHAPHNHHFFFPLPLFVFLVSKVQWFRPKNICILRGN